MAQNMQMQINGLLVSIAFIPTAIPYEAVLAEITVAGEVFPVSVWQGDYEGVLMFAHGYRSPLSHVDDDAAVAAKIRRLAALLSVTGRNDEIEDALDILFEPVIDRLYRAIADGSPIRFLA